MSAVPGECGECGDARLVQLAQAGSAEAFAELYRRHYPAVVAACTRRRTGDAEEVAQAAFLRAFERIDRCQGDARFGAWVQVIARHVSVDVARTRSRDLARPAVAVMPGSSADWPEEHALRQERVETLRSVMGRLPRRQREVLYARDVEGRRPPEIAAALGLSLGAVDSLLLRARKAAAAGYRTMAAESGMAQTASTAAVAVAGGGVASGPGRLVRAVTDGFDAVMGAVSRLGGRVAALPAGGLDLVAGAAVVVALAVPAAGGVSPAMAGTGAGPGRPALTAPAWPGPARPPADALAPVPEAGLTPPAPPATPPAPAPPEAAVPGAPVSPPPARPNPVGHVFSVLDVEARFTGLSLPWTPEAPATGLAPVDQNRPAPDGERRPGRRVWNASREGAEATWSRAEATWSEGRRQGSDTWQDVRGG
jgi:RNA polymerase sigma-70 factor, ECF subfamily